VLGNPKAWLGTAYHQVLEKIAAAELKDDFGEIAERLWDAAVAAHYERSVGHPSDRRFGRPETWPGYHLARASALLRARELVTARGTGFKATGSGDASTVRERQFVAFGGKLVGKPDVIRQEEIIDYKSGAILEHDELSQSDVVKLAYVRQLRIYGFLVKKCSVGGRRVGCSCRSQVLAWKCRSTQMSAYARLQKRSRFSTITTRM
jgi:hypothetical protein